MGLDVDLQATKRATKGHANATLRGVTYADLVRGLNASLATTFDGQDAIVHLAAHDAAGNEVTLDSEKAHLAAGALDPRAWRDATGRLHATTNVDLERIQKNPPGTELPFDELRGRLLAKLDVERDDANKRPTVIVDGWTRDLLFTTQPKEVSNGDRTVTVVGRSFHSEGLDAHVKASFDSETGKGAIDAILRDKQGELVEANASSTLPMSAILAGTAREALLVTPVRAHLELPLRSVGDVPALMGSLPVRGNVGLTFDAEGTAKEPHLQALVHARDVTDADDPTPVPISFDAAAIYDGKERARRSWRCRAPRRCST